MVDYVLPDRLLNLLIGSQIHVPGVAYGSGMFFLIERRLLLLVGHEKIVDHLCQTTILAPEESILAKLRDTAGTAIRAQCIDEIHGGVAIRGDRFMKRFTEVNQFLNAVFEHDGDPLVMVCRACISACCSSAGMDSRRLTQRLTFSLIR